MSKIQNFWVEILSSYYTGKKTVSALNIPNVPEKRCWDSHLTGSAYLKNSKFLGGNFVLLLHR